MTKCAIKYHSFSPWAYCLYILQKAIHMKKIISLLLPLILYSCEKLKTHFSTVLGVFLFEFQTVDEMDREG